MIKFRVYLDKDKETKWLNEMAEQGWAMKHFFLGVYTFEQCEKGKYQYQIDFGDTAFGVSKDYREFMEDSNVEIVQTWGFWVILRKETEKGEFVLYSDVDSQIKHYTKILRLFQTVTIIDLLALLYEAYAASVLDNALAWTCLFVVLAAVIVFLNCVANTRNIIAELKERKTGISDTKRTNLSTLLAIGFMINACTFLFDANTHYSLRLMAQIAAIAFMVAGIYDTARKVKNNG